MARRYGAVTVSALRRETLPVLVEALARSLEARGVWDAEDGAGDIQAIPAIKTAAGA